MINCQVMNAIQRRRAAFEAYRDEFRWKLMGEVVVLKWLVLEKPTGFVIPSFENFGRLVCRAETDSEDGTTYIYVNATYKAMEQTVDVQEVMFSIQEADGE